MLLPMMVHETPVLALIPASAMSFTTAVTGMRRAISSTVGVRPSKLTVPTTRMSVPSAVQSFTWAIWRARLGYPPASTTWSATPSRSASSTMP